ncbi:MAG: pilus assembly protein [Anaerolineae bacterium]|nr:pilus assembly protein [Anaerolineae bacterium]
MKPQRRLERGQSLIEMIFIIPILLVLVGGAVDVGRAFIILVAVENAAGEGALYGSVNPACLADDHSDTICQLSESLNGRIIEEGRPFIDLTEDMIVSNINDGDGGATITAGSLLEITVTYTYVPLTPIGHILWGSEAVVTATAEQEILSPPPPGYRY